MQRNARFAVAKWGNCRPNWAKLYCEIQYGKPLPAMVSVSLGR
jgi:hypothetical protein